MIFTKLFFALSCFNIYPGILAGNITIEDSARIVEKVYLQTDRDIYSPGDDIWFKAYLVEASERLLTDHSANLHVELISPAAEILNSRIVKLTEGLGNGDFSLPGRLKPGRYQIRAYTNYMRNFGEELFFCKDIIVIQPYDIGKNTPDNSAVSAQRPEISFFPEGGSLVYNVTSIVAFKAVDSLESGFDVSGKIYSGGGEEVTTFKSTHKGMGTFYLDPVPGVKYYAVASGRKGDLFRYQIPESFKTGVVMNVSINNPDELHLIFKTNQETLTLLNNQDLLLTVSARGTTYKTYSFRMGSPDSFFNLPTEDLPEGIVMLTLSGPGNIPLCERLVFIKKNEDIKVKVETDRGIYNTRDSVSVRISMVADSSQLPGEVFLSLASSENIFMGNSQGYHSTIASWFLLESDIRGPVEDPSYYFDPSDPNRLKELDLLLLTQGWRDFRWKYKKMDYPPENGFTISGRVRKKFADVSLKNSQINIGIIKDSRFYVRTVGIDTAGRFGLDGVDFTGIARLIVSAAGQNGKLQGWLLLDSMKYKPSDIKSYSHLSLFQTGGSHAGEDQILSQDQYHNGYSRPGGKTDYLLKDADYKATLLKKYKISDTIRLPEVTVTAERQNEFTKARDKSFQYARGEPIGGGAANVRILNSPDAAGGSLVVIDGVVSANGLEGFPTQLIERIDFLSGGDAAVWGVAGENGVISVITKDDWRTDHTPYLHSVSINIKGYDETRIFYSPKHKSPLESDAKPDIRSTLFWEPNIKLQKNKDVCLSYYNSDNPSTVKIIIEGITSRGIPVTATTEYDVH
jgi:MG2 domain